MLKFMHLSMCDSHTKPELIAIVKEETNSTLHNIYWHGSKIEEVKFGSMTNLGHPDHCLIIWLVINKVAIVY